MKKIILALFAFMLYSMPAFASMCNPADNIYDYLVPGCIRQDESYIATGTGTDVCVTAAKICSGTQIPNANLAAITGTSMVSGAALYNLSSTPSGAGALPIVNGGTGNTSRQAAMDALFSSSMSGTSGQALVSNGTDAIVGYPSSLTISSMAQGDVLYVDSTPKVNRLAAGTKGQALTTVGSSNNPAFQGMTTTGDIEYYDGSVRQRLPIGTTGQVLTVASGIPSYAAPAVTNWVPTNIQVFTTSGTWTKPAGCSSVYVKVWGSGGGGGASGSGSYGGEGGFGGYSEGYTAVSGNVTVTVDQGGIGVDEASGTAGGVTSFAGTTKIQSTGGGAGLDTGISGSGGVGSNGQINFTGPSVLSGSASPVSTYGLFSIGYSSKSVGTAGSGIGSGGTGNNNTGTQTGGNGAPGLVIAYC